MSKEKINILFIYPTQSTFIQKDEKLLKELANVVSFHFDVKQKKKLPITFIKQIFFLFKNILNTDKVVCRFAGFHSVLPVLFSKLFSKKSFLICGGNEGHNFPSFNYGNINRKGLAWATGFSLRNCNFVLPVHSSLINFEYTYSNQYPQKQGIQNIFPTKAKFIPVNNGYDADFFQLKNANKIENSFCTVINNIDETAIELKGLDLIFELAQKRTNIIVTVIGTLNEENRYCPPNVKFAGKLSPNALVEFLNTQQFYFQLSVAEGFPNALCEAMLCGCVPIGSNVFSIPEIIADTGYILQEKNLNQLQQILDIAVNRYDESQGVLARKRIAEHYPLALRKIQFAKVFGLKN